MRMRAAVLYQQGRERPYRESLPMVVETLELDGADPDCAAKVRELTGGGVEFAFEMAGTLAAWETAYGVLRRGGTLVSVGLTAANAGFDRLAEGDVVRQILAFPR